MTKREREEAEERLLQSAVAALQKWFKISPNGQVGGFLEIDTDAEMCSVAPKDD